VVDSAGSGKAKGKSRGKAVAKARQTGSSPAEQAAKTDHIGQPQPGPSNPATDSFDSLDKTWQNIAAPGTYRRGYITIVINADRSGMVTVEGERRPRGWVAEDIAQVVALLIRAGENDLVTSDMINAVVKNAKIKVRPGMGIARSGIEDFVGVVPNEGWYLVGPDAYVKLPSFTFLDVRLKIDHKKQGWLEIGGEIMPDILSSDQATILRFLILANGGNVYKSTLANINNLPKEIRRLKEIDGLSIEWNAHGYWRLTQSKAKTASHDYAGVVLKIDNIGKSARLILDGRRGRYIARDSNIASNSRVKLVRELIDAGKSNEFVTEAHIKDVLGIKTHIPTYLHDIGLGRHVGHIESGYYLAILSKMIPFKGGQLEVDQMVGG
jgi:hypothetical protein